MSGHDMLRRALSVLVALLVAILPSSAAFGQQVPGGTERYLKRFEALPLPRGAIEVIQYVVEFAPNAWAQPHTHGGHAYITIVEGELTMRIKGEMHRYGPGDTFVEVMGDLYEGGNLTASRTVLLATYVLPHGAIVTTVAPQAPSLRPGAAAPKFLNESRTELESPPGPYEVVQMVLDYAPGARSASYSYRGRTLMSVLAGEYTVQEGSAQRTYKAGDTRIVDPLVPFSETNAGSAPASLAATTLLLAGEPLTASVAPTPAALPRTGDPALPHVSLAEALSAAGLLLAAGFATRRMARV